MYPISDRVLNLATVGGQPHFARVEMTLEFLAPDTTAAKKTEEKKAEAAHGSGTTSAAPLDPALEPVNAYKPLIDDALVRIFGAKTVEGLTSAEGKEALKTEILEAVTEIVPKPDIVGVYIIRMIVQ
jgi:hypothetical protein